jgi:Transglycosylase-like domain
MRKLLPLSVVGLVLAPSAAAEPSSSYTVDAAHREAVREARTKTAAATARAKRKAAPPVSPALRAIAECESGGDPRAIGGGGLYRGKYQFSVGTWRGVGGTGDPAAASEAEQDRRATILYERSGPGQWPVCGS